MLHWTFKRKKKKTHTQGEYVTLEQLHLNCGRDCWVRLKIRCVTLFGSTGSTDQHDIDNDVIPIRNAHGCCLKGF